MMKQLIMKQLIIKQSIMKQAIINQRLHIAKLLAIVSVCCTVSACTTANNKSIGFEEMSEFNAQQSGYIQPISGKVVLFTKSPRSNNEDDYKRMDFTY